jgi:hypothetical protein
MNERYHVNKGGRVYVCVGVRTNSLQAAAPVLVDDDEAGELSILGILHDLLEREGAALAERCVGDDLDQVLDEFERNLKRGRSQPSLSLSRGGSVGGEGRTLVGFWAVVKRILGVLSPLKNSENSSMASSSCTSYNDNTQGALLTLLSVK